MGATDTHQDSGKQTIWVLFNLHLTDEETEIYRHSVTVGRLQLIHVGGINRKRIFLLLV